MNNKIVEEEKRTLGILTSQIANFDAKATTLLSILGTVFALSIIGVDTIRQMESSNHKTSLIIIYFVFLLSVTFSMLLAIIVIRPRKRDYNITQEKLSTIYYFDLVRLDELEYIDKIQNGKEEQTLLYEQIQQNAKICRRKHEVLNITLFSLVFVTIFFYITIILMVK